MNDAVLPMALEAAGRFQWKGEAEKVSRYGSGHINDTYLVQTKGAGRYILQRISPAAFREPLKLMENIERVTSYLAGAIGRRGGDPLRETLTLVPTLDGRACWQDGQGHIWRAYLFIEHTRSYQLPESARLMYEAGLAFGAFQRELDGFPAETLYEVIPRFHDTPDRMKRLEGAAEKNPAGRLHQVEKELDFCRRRAEKAAELNRLLKQGELPVRVTHNDTKLNNVLFDAASLRGLCVIDLDTVMPGLCAYDFGDAIRFGANTALEDEKDLSKVRFSLPMFQAYLKG